jgi:single-stranded-DNA-specific exonuclease
MFDRAHGRQDAAPTNASVGAGLAPPASRAALNALVDLVAVATVADVMPLTDENRTFVKYGLAMLREGRRPALACLLGVAGIDPARVSSRDIAFGVAPRINAAGRLEDAAAGVELFLTDDPARMREIAQRMDALNRERQAIQKKCVDDCMALARDAGPFLLLRPPAAHEGVSGIVAGKVREATGLPCAVVAESADDGALYLKGSARSAGRLDLIALLRRHEEFFVRVGGHAAAAGFLIRAGDEEQLRAALCADLAALLADDPALLDEEETVDADVAPEDVTEALADALEALAPFGAGWREPLLSFTALPSDITDVRAMGADGAHGRFKAAGVPCTWFRWDPDLLGKPLQITGTLGWNHFRGQKILQFTVAQVQEIIV